MKIAIISTKPASLGSGTEVRNYYLLKGLKQEFNVEYYIPNLPTKLPEQTPLLRLLDILKGKIPNIEYNRRAYFDSETINKIKKADIIQVQELGSFFAIEKYIDDFHSIIVLDAHNIEYKRFLAGTETEGLLTKLIGRLLAQKIKAVEINSLSKIDYILTCSETDKKYYTKYFDKKRIFVIPNGIESKSYKKHKTIKQNNILFMGLLSYGPNIDAIKYYLSDIHPHVKEYLDDIQFTIIGKNPPRWLLEKVKNDKSIHVKGFVDNLQEEFNNASVCICPLRFGSGTRLKLLEYMAAAQAIVSTSIGAEGLEITQNTQMLISDEPIDFAQNIYHLLKDKKRAKILGVNAHKFVVENYDWGKITNNLCSYYSKISAVE